MKFKCLLCGNDRSLTFDPGLDYDGRVLPSGAIEVEAPPEELIVAVIKAHNPGGLLCGVCRNHVYIYEEEDLMAGLRCSDCGENQFICRSNVEMDGHITPAGNLEVPDMTGGMIVNSINELFEDDEPTFLECSSCNTMKQYQLAKSKGGNSAAVLQEV